MKLPAAFALSLLAPFFSDPSIVRIAVQAPLASLFSDARQKPNTVVFGTIRYTGASGKQVVIDGVEISVRGHTSRNDCAFPKLRLSLPRSEPIESTIFSGCTGSSSAPTAVNRRAKHSRRKGASGTTARRIGKHSSITCSRSSGSRRSGPDRVKLRMSIRPARPVQRQPSFARHSLSKTCPMPSGGWG
jgi:hypothetical protein